MIAAEGRYMAAASVADLTDNTTEPALRQHPEPDQEQPGKHEVTYTARPDAIGSERGAARPGARLA